MSREVVTITQAISFGPAMSALSRMQRSFVLAYNNAGQSNASEACRAAGYSENWVAQQASQLLHSPTIQAAVREDIVARFAGNLAEAQATILEIMRDKKDPKRLDATKVVLGRGGLPEHTVTEHNINVTLTFEQKLDRARSAILAAGGNPDKELAEFIDAEYTEVTLEDLI